MKIVLWTQSPPKVQAIESATKKCIYFENDTIEIIPVKASSWISDMPLSLEENILWAKNRALHAKELSSGDLFIWMEWGTTLIGEDAFLFGVVYIISKDGQENYGISNMMKLPKIFQKRLYENGEELWPVLEEITWNLDARKQNGAFGAWSDNMLTRSDQFELAFLSAVPFFYNKYYIS